MLVGEWFIILYLTVFLFYIFFSYLVTLNIAKYNYFNNKYSTKKNFTNLNYYYNYNKIITSSLVSFYIKL